MCIGVYCCPATKYTYGVKNNIIRLLRCFLWTRSASQNVVYITLSYNNKRYNNIIYVDLIAETPTTRPNSPTRSHLQRLLQVRSHPKHTYNVVHNAADQTVVCKHNIDEDPRRRISNRLNLHNITITRRVYNLLYYYNNSRTIRARPD